MWALIFALSGCVQSGPRHPGALRAHSINHFSYGTANYERKSAICSEETSLKDLQVLLAIRAVFAAGNQGHHEQIPVGCREPNYETGSLGFLIAPCGMWKT
jgi:hypothetical protein